MRKRWQVWLEETHASQFELGRHFLRQQLAGDVFASSDQLQRLVIGGLVALGFAGPFISYFYRAKYGYLHGLATPDLYVAAVRADRLFLISLSMVVAGFVTAVQWQGLFPSVRDYYVFKALPVRLYQVFLARFLAAFGIVALVVLDLNLTASVAFPGFSSGPWQVPEFGIRYILAHAAATVCAGLFVFFAVAALQGVLLNLLPAAMFERLSVAIQALFAIVLVTSVTYVFDIPNWHEAIALRPRWMWFFPPAWFLGWYETLLSGGDAYFRRLAATGLKALGLAIAISLAAYVLSYHRHANYVLERSRSPRRSSWMEAVGAGILRWLVPNACQRAVFAFSLQTIHRSRYHKLMAGFFAGMALVLSLSTAGPLLLAHLRSGQAWELWQIESILAVPLVLGAIIILSLDYVFQIPAELRANWIFRMAEGGNLAGAAQCRGVIIHFVWACSGRVGHVGYRGGRVRRSSGRVLRGGGDDAHFAVHRAAAERAAQAALRLLVCTRTR